MGLSWDSIVGIVAVLRADRSRDKIPQVQDIFLFSKSSRSVMESTQPPVQWVSRFLSRDKEAETLS
jgi:hypothetical protein